MKYKIKVTPPESYGKIIEFFLTKKTWFGPIFNKWFWEGGGVESFKEYCKKNNSKEEPIDIKMLREIYNKCERFIK